jgi:hypothetical protein
MPIVTTHPPETKTFTNIFLILRPRFFTNLEIGLGIDKLIILKFDHKSILPVWLFQGLLQAKE